MRHARRSHRLLAMVAAIASLAILRTGFAQNAPSAADNGSSYWGAWPAHADPLVDGDKVVDNLLTRPMMWDRPEGMIYPEVCTAYGSLRLVATAHDQARLDKLVQRYDVILTPRGKQLITKPNHVDMSVFGTLPLELYILTGSPAEKQVALAAVKKLAVTRVPADMAGNGARVVKADVPAIQKEAEAQWASMNMSHQDQITRWLTIGKGHADAQWATPRADGLTDQTRMWVDDMFMITAVECQAYRATGDPVYLDRNAKELAVYLDELQKPNGLFYHAPDSPFYWGRGNGWVAVGMSELLSELPADHPQRARILDGYRKMMAALLKYQAPSGMWRQLIDNDQSWEESSSTGMFTFAMANGVRRGWLDEATYKPAAKKAWVALSSHIDATGNVTDVCVGTNKGTTTQYYLDRQRTTGDFHGEAGYVWAAWAMINAPAKK